jgi:hypothetical protein
MAVGENMKDQMRPVILVAIINAAILLVYAIFERDFPVDVKWSRAIILAAALLIICSIPVARWIGGKALGFIANAQLLLLSCLLPFVLVEGLFRIASDIFPDNVRRLVDAGSQSAVARERMVELLPYSPYAKPRANTTIHIPGYYGPKGSFVYEWRTDRNGFKNSDAIAAREAVEVVAPGDSFTEGMGVLVEQTWTAKLSALGHPTYSLGVQGYAPTQFRGAYEHYGRALPHKWVVVGYTGGVYLRENYFQSGKENNRSSQELPSAISRLVERDEIEEQRPIYMETKDGYRVPIVRRKHHNFVTSAIVALAWQTAYFTMFFDIKAGTSPGDPRFINDQTLRQSGDFPLKLMARYRGELAAIAKSDADPVQLGQDPLWLSTERNFERIIEMAREDGARPLFLFFPSRNTIYYERATGRPLPPNASDLVQAALLTRFAERHGVEILDMTPVFRNYVANLNDDSPIEQYPYLRVDGHPSPEGHELIAGEVARFLSTRQSVSR